MSNNEIWDSELGKLQRRKRFAWILQGALDYHKMGLNKKEKKLLGELLDLVNERNRKKELKKNEQETK